MHFYHDISLKQWVLDVDKKHQDHFHPKFVMRVDVDRKSCMKDL
jgi:hypothetical protein